MNRLLPSDFNARLRRSSNVRYRARGRTRAVVKIAACLVIAAGIAAAGYAGYSRVAGFIDSSRIFALREVGVRGYEHLSPADIIRASRLSIGENIFSVRLSAVRKNIMSLPWINSVSIRKLPPHRIDITVTERRAYCMILLDRLYYVDTNGIIFKPVSDSDSVNYPVITGFHGGGELVDADVQPVIDAVSFLEGLDRGSVIGSRDISELHMDDTGYTVITNDGLLIRFGSTDLGVRIGRLNKIEQYFGDRMQMFASVDLRFKGMGVVRYKPGILSDTSDKSFPSDLSQQKEVNNLD